MRAAGLQLPAWQRDGRRSRASKAQPSNSKTNHTVRKRVRVHARWTDEQLRENSEGEISALSQGELERGGAQNEYLGSTRPSTRHRDGHSRAPAGRGAGRAWCAHTSTARCKKAPIVKNEAPPVNQCKYVWVEKCPSTMRHKAKRSGDSCGRVAKTELRRDRDPGMKRKHTKARSSTFTVRLPEKDQSNQAPESRSHPHRPSARADQCRMATWKRTGATELRSGPTRAARGREEWC